VTDVTERSMQVRMLATAATSGQAFDLRCRIREGMMTFMQREYPQHLPKLRTEEAGAGSYAEGPLAPEGMPAIASRS
jgi:hypothetical protein